MKEWHNTVCLDFDGVIAKFGTEDAGEPVDGVNDLASIASDSMQGGMLKSIRAGLQLAEGRESYNNKLAFRQCPIAEVVKDLLVRLCNPT